MLAQADTSLSGSLTHHDLPGVMQMLGHAHQTGALHINAGETDALLFFDAGEITHAECGALFGDEAVIHILKGVHNGAGVYKFVYGATSAQHTVLRTATDLMLDAMREFDEGNNEQEHPPLNGIAPPEAADHHFDDHANSVHENDRQPHPIENESSNDSSKALTESLVAEELPHDHQHHDHLENHVLNDENLANKESQ
jgi:hypothetical protein